MKIMLIDESNKDIMDDLNHPKFCAEKDCLKERSDLIELCKYFYFTPKDRRFTFHELLEEYPDCPKKFYFFFCGNLERREAYPELSNFYDTLYGFIQDRIM